MQEISEGRERVINVRDIDPGIVTGSSVSCSITLIRRAACNWWWTTIRDRCTTNSRPGMARVATGPTLSKAPTSGVCACGICGTEGGERFVRIPPKYRSRDRRMENISWKKMWRCTQQIHAGASQTPLCWL